ncbi:MAG: formylglycine-generating enzyme family protein [Labilithrix sp.]|nr:formylglycine-generating enzyme family protein [Labilithrix sp.]
MRASRIGVVVLGAIVVGVAAWLASKKPTPPPPEDAAAVAVGSASCTPPPRFGEREGDGPPGMAAIPGGEFAMGDASGDGMAWERPVHTVRLSDFYIDVFEVTNAQFRAFVDATGHQTTAERPAKLEEIMRQVPPGTPPPPPEKLRPSSLVFKKTKRAVALGQPGDWMQWWSYVPGADWRHPSGPGDAIEGNDYHPVVHVSWDDAVAYCAWAGRRLPTEAEWERAARGRLERKRFTWGDEPFDPKRANIWQGSFPHENTREDGYEATAPVGKFPPNGYGLHDMAGNVWEWVSDWYRADTYAIAAARGVDVDPRGPATSLDPDEPHAPKRVIRGGSFLCTTTYCASFRPAARMKTSPDSSSNHQGFRCAISADAWSKATVGDH